MSVADAPGGVENPEVNCFRQMFTETRSGEPINDGLTAARSTTPAIPGWMATHSGQKIAWDEAYASDLVPAPKSYTRSAEKRPIPPSS